MARADKGMGGGVAGGGAGPNGHQGAGTPDGELTEGDLGNEIMGDAGQQGPSDVKHGQSRDEDKLSNTRTTQPGGNRPPDEGVLDAFEKMDKDVRAERDLNAGQISDHEAEPTESLVDGMSDPEKADSTLAARNGVG